MITLDQAIDSVINLPGLLQNEKATVNFTIPWSSTLPGVHIVKAVIDADQVINELSESNNENVRPIIVGDAANMHFNSLTASIINPILNQNITIQSSIENNGTLTCTSTISFYYINNLNDKIFIKSMPITLAGNTSQNVNFIWKVLDEETTIIGEITNSTTQEFDYGDNNTSFQLGKMNIVLEATPACTTGTLFAGILGGTQPYNYQWSNGSANATMTDIEGNYNITVTDATGQTASASGVIPTCKLTLSLKAYLQGYYQGNGTMLEALFNQGRVNLHTHCDSIDVELHNTNDYSLVASHRALLKTDGTLNAFFETALMNNSYYIVLKHRNSLETWSASPILLSSNTMYDFTMAVNKAFGSNMLEIEPSIFALYTGDINQDGFIDSFDFPLLDNDIFNGVSGVYINTDLNGDGFVDSFDFPLFDINSFNGISVIRP
ncbi:MAG TPA: CARDB domain-containing protein [Chitinophagaceae bacterium]|nr:CARDB domain-containing protein [Chitinophagaceae bacterium]